MENYTLPERMTHRSMLQDLINRLRELQDTSNDPFVKAKAAAIITFLNAANDALIALSEYITARDQGVKYVKIN